MKENRELIENKFILGAYEEVGFRDTMEELNYLLQCGLQVENRVINVCSKEFYDKIQGFIENLSHQEVYIETKYKSVTRKVKPVALPLPFDCKEKISRALRQPNLRDLKKIGHKFMDFTLNGLNIGCDGFLTKCEEKYFRNMFSCHRKAFAFEAHEIECLDPSIVAPMVIFTIPREQWNLQPIRVPRAYLSKLVDLLHEKIKMEILEPSMAPYSN